MNPHQEVINDQPKVLIVGYGWVGQYIGKYFTHSHWVDQDQQFHLSCDNSMVDPEDKYDISFICVPTPPKNNGLCDTSAVESVIKKYRKIVEAFCIKSTVEIGTTEKLSKKYHTNICFSPEYLGETLGHPLNKANPETFIILGGPLEVTSKFAEAWTLVTNSYTKIYQTDSKTAELCKLMENSFIATKVSFCNEFFDLAEHIGVDYNQLRELWLADPRVSRSHTYVFRNNRGFGGKCLPKDITNLVKYFTKIGKKPEMMEFILDYNKKLRSK